ncbi:hypothetical protein [Fodinicurvata sp. EGI_FJ10296]|uniref:hypothetical protein n=1 Tax=Fodinicurvata sp. EGI_FJ10296 TaxID=3231908 RepID=UPI0034541A51
MKRIFLIPATFCALAAITIATESQDRAGPLSVQTAEAQLMGKTPYGARQRNRSLAAQFQHADRQNEDGQAALEQYVENHTYNSSSTSVGNLSEINQILSEGSSGTVDQGTDQTSEGDQGSSGSTDVAIDSETSSTGSEDGQDTTNGDDTQE